MKKLIISITLCLLCIISYSQEFTLDLNAKMIRNNGVLKKGGFWRCDKVFTVLAVELPTRYTPNGVAILNADGKNFRVDCGPLKEV